MVWLILIVIIVGAAAGDVCWQLRTIRKAVQRSRTEQHQWWLIQADEQVATATRAAIVDEKVAEILAEMAHDRVNMAALIKLHVTPTRVLGDIQKELADLYRLELSIAAGAVQDINTPVITIEYIRDGAGPKVAMDVAEAIGRAAKREETTPQTPEDGDKN